MGQIREPPEQCRGRVLVIKDAQEYLIVFLNVPLTPNGGINWSCIFFFEIYTEMKKHTHSKVGKLDSILANI